MGAWGSGNFDDDSALDYAGSLCQSIEAEIDRRIASKKLAGDNLLTDVMPRLAVLAVLAEHCLGAGPVRGKIQAWQKRSLEIFDVDTAKMYFKKKDAKERRRVIVDTFELLGKLAVEGWSGSDHSS